MCNTGIGGQLRGGLGLDGEAVQGRDADAVLPNELATSQPGPQMAGPTGGATLGCSGCADVGYCRRGLDPEQLQSGCTGAAP